MDDEPFSVVPSADGGLSFTGAITELELDRLAQTLAGWTGAGRLDLSRLTYLPSAALNVFILAMRQRPVALAAQVGTIAERVLAITGLPYEKLDAQP